jgi:2-polyprenyl-3-methyl-5-hydroxy-6-metoxy-1,4-benzoquinol methylase
MLSSHHNKNQTSYKENANLHSKLGLNSTLYLAYRDIPKLLKKYLINTNKKLKILDFGCGAGLSTELISTMARNLGYSTEIVGLDIN